MIKKISLLAGAASVLLLAACQSMEQGTGQKASASLDSRSGSNTKGTVSFLWQEHNVLVTVNFN
jgi:Cu-Zn family superoxide dismutase